MIPLQKRIQYILKIYMVMNTVTAEIDVAKPTDQHVKTYTHEEVFKSAEKVLNDYFGTDIKLDI